MLLPFPCDMKHAFIVSTKVLCGGWGIALTEGGKALSPPRHQGRENAVLKSLP